MPRGSSIILVGFMGAGKSEVGRRLAGRLGRAFIDTDEALVASAGCSVPEIFAAEGEAGFRDRETALLRSLSLCSDSVLATGGGILNRDENLALLRQLGRLVCLTARPAVILARTRPWETRPLLAGAADPLAVVERLLAERAARYTQADLTIDTSDRSVDEVVDEICRVFA